MLYGSLGHAEVVQDVAVEGELEPLSADVFKVLYVFALEAGVVDQDVDPAPFVNSLLHNAPADE